MNTKSIIVICSCLFCLSVGCSPATQRNLPSANMPTPSVIPTVEEYILQPGDQLDIKFFYNPEINEEVIIRPDGKISLQLIDEVQASGLTPSQLDNFLTSQYAKELQNPSVTVILRSISTSQVYVGGEVNNQGLITLQTGMTPLQAIFNCGGFKESARPDKTIIIRKGPGNQPIPIELNLTDIIQGTSAQANLVLNPHDIVFVPKSGIAKANKFVNQYIENLLLFRGVSFGFAYRIDDKENNN